MSDYKERKKSASEQRVAQNAKYEYFEQDKNDYLHNRAIEWFKRPSWYQIVEDKKC